jgi:predicted MFS family arabinose efflux permease
MVVLIAIPAKLVLGGFVFFAAPLALRDLGFSQPAIGRVVMLYGLCMLPAIALGAWLSDRARMGAMLMVVAGAATGMVLMLPLGLDIVVVLPFAVALVGALQGLASAPMLALAPTLAAEPGAPPTPMLLAFLRLAERIGSVAGPMLAAYLLMVGGTGAVMLTLGAVSVLAALAYAAGLAMRGQHRGSSTR